MKRQNKIVLSACAAVVVISATPLAVASVAQSSPVSKERQGTPPAGKFGYIDPAVLLTSGGYLYVPKNARLLPASSDTHTLKVVNKDGKISLVTNCSFAVGGNSAPIPPTATQVAEIICEP